MGLVEFIIISAIGWLGVVILDFSENWRRTPDVIKQISKRIFSEFWLGLALHCTMFYLFYGAMGYFVVQGLQTAIQNATGQSARFLTEILIACIFSWAVGGVMFLVNIVPMMRMKSDDRWLLRRWLLQELKKAENPRAHLETLITKIQTNPKKESSQDALFVLRELAMRGDSVGATVHRVLSEHNLL